MRYGTRQSPPSATDRRGGAGGRATLRHAAGALRNRSIPIARLAASSRIRHVPIRAVVFVLRTRVDQETRAADRRCEDGMAHRAVWTVDATPHARPALELFQRLLSTRTQFVKPTFAALRFARDADLPSVLNQPMRENGPLLRRDQLHQILFDLHGVDIRG